VDHPWIKVGPIGRRANASATDLFSGFQPWECIMIASLRRAVAVLALSIGASGALAAEAPAIAVQFPSVDGMMLTGYLFVPSKGPRAKSPAIVMMHGRAGPYSSAANGRYDATTLSKRHAFWGHYWTEQGYAALLVDGFGPRGYPGGFPIHSYASRPDTVNEVTVRPLDAYGALKYLRSLPGIDGSRIALQGWSNGGSATIATMSDEVLATSGMRPRTGFRGAIALYPACALQDRFANGYRPYAPVRVFAGDADEEVSAARCARLVRGAQAAGGDIDIKIYPGATHGFDDPSAKRQSDPSNVDATNEAVPAISTFVRWLFGIGGRV
jgi:carboxymethylenebutenolidase